MSKRLEPVRKSVRDTLEDLLAGHREAAISGPQAALKYLRRTLEGQASLPNAVKAVVYDLVADACAKTGEWASSIEAVGFVLKHLPDLEEAFPHEYRRMLEGMSCFERGIQAYGEIGDFKAALTLCERAIELALGEHYEAKLRSLEWAREG
jgi:hypothetical protein